MATNPKFSAQHYNAIAKDIREVRSDLDTTSISRLDSDPVLNIVCHKLAIRFAADNPRFDIERFVAACMDNA